LFNLVIALLQESGKNPEHIVNGTSLSFEQLGDVDTRISFRQATALFANALAISDDPALGLTLGARESLCDWGLLGYAIAASKTGIEAMEVSSRYTQTATNLTRIDIIRLENAYAIQVAPLHPLGALHAFAMEEVFAAAVSICRSIVTEYFNPVELQLTYAEPEYTKQYQKYFNCPIRFNCPSNRLIVSDEDAVRPILTHNPITAQLAKHLCEQELDVQQQQGGLIYEVYCSLLQSPGNFPSLQQVADDMNVSRRTISRSLKELGTSYQALLDQARESLATEYLKTSDLKLEDIAYLVGFSDAGNFHRAFKKWTGRSPSSLRKDVSYRRVRQ
jgi:AraC-like DNA-binding protein